MSRFISVLAPSALALAVLSGCASKQAPAELHDARAAYNRAQAGPAPQTNRAGLMEAQEALAAAERKFDESPGSDEVKTLGHIAQRKAEIAETDARAAMLRAQQQDAEKTALQIQTAQAQMETAKEREATGVAERRAKVALDRLGLATKDEPRGTVITLPGADMFATNKAEILPEAKQRLTTIAKAIKSVVAEQAPRDVGRQIMLVGYTDDTGGEEHNMKLSERRAAAVRSFFAEHGVDSAIMQAEGRGEAEPIASNETPEGRAENRRVEIVITPSGGESVKPSEGAPESTPPESQSAPTPKPTTPSEEPTMPGEETTPETMPEGSEQESR